jgi:hypothetical protein
MDRETAEIKTPRPPRKGLFPEDEVVTPLELAVRDTYRFLAGGKGRAELADVEYAKRINPRFAAEIYADAVAQQGRRLGRKPDSPDTLQAVKRELWRHTLPSRKNRVYFRFQPGSGKLFGWGAFSLIGLPKNISAHRKKGGHLYLAIDYLDTFDAQPTRDTIVGKLDQWTLFTEHVFDRLMQRLPEANVSKLSEALKLLPKLMLESEGKALIEDNEGGSFLAVKTPYGCLYFAGYLRIREGTVFRFYKTVFVEHELYSGRRKKLGKIAATSDTWSNEPMSVQGWTRVPITG